MPDNLKIPTDWTFKNANVAKHFDDHVREQLPFYDMATQAVEHIGRHYIPRNGLVYDIGCSTGNIGRQLAATLEQRNAELIGIEESKEMAAIYHAPGRVVVAEAIGYDYKMFDFAVLFLILMFLPIGERKAFVMHLRSMIKPGGAIVIVDKINTAPGYAGTVMRRLAMRWKIDNGASHEDVVKKELSLAGYQRPLDPSWLEPIAHRWFQFGEFAGWIIERGE